TMAVTFQKIALVLIPGLMAVGYFMFRTMLSRIATSQSGLEEKVRRYFALVLIRAAFFEIAFFFCCVAAFLTRVQLFLWIAPVIFFVFLLLRPTAEGIVSDLSLNPSDGRKLMEA